MWNVFFKNTHMRVLSDRILLLLLQWFFIGYWILKTGLDIYPGPFSFYCPSGSAPVGPFVVSSKCARIFLAFAGPTTAANSSSVN